MSPTVTLSSLRKNAKLCSKKDNIKLADALNLTANQHGFRDWNEAVYKLSKFSEPLAVKPSPVAPEKLNQDDSALEATKRELREAQSKLKIYEDADALERQKILDVQLAAEEAEKARLQMIARNSEIHVPKIKILVDKLYELFHITEPGKFCGQFMSHLLPVGNYDECRSAHRGTEFWMAFEKFDSLLNERECDLLKLISRLESAVRDSERSKIQILEANYKTYVSTKDVRVELFKGVYELNYLAFKSDMPKDQQKRIHNFIDDLWKIPFEANLTGHFKLNYYDEEFFNTGDAYQRVQIRHFLQNLKNFDHGRLVWIQSRFNEMLKPIEEKFPANYESARMVSALADPSELYSHQYFLSLVKLAEKGGEKQTGLRRLFRFSKGT